MNKNVYRMFCVSLSAVILACVLTSCKGNTDSDKTTAPTGAESTSVTNVEEELNGLKTNTLKGYSYDGKYYAKREKTKDGNGLYVLTVYLAEDDSRVIELHPSDQRFTKFSWLNDEYKIYVYSDNTVTDAFHLYENEWQKCSI